MKAITRLRVVAELNDAQITALRQHVIPILRDAIGPDMGPGRIHWDVNNGFRSKPNVDNAAFYARSARWGWDRITKFIEAIASKQTPVKRAAILRKYLAQSNKPSRKGHNVATLLNETLKDSKKALATSKLGMTPEGKEKLTALMTNSTINLLRKSWPFIVGEIQAEYSDLLKQYHFMEIEDKTNNAAIRKHFIEYMKSLGWTLEPFSDSNDSRYKGLPCAVNGGMRITLIPGDKKYDFGKAGAIYPQYQIPVHGKFWFDYGRTGVEGGEVYLDEDDILEGVIDQQIERLEKTIRAAEEREANGVSVKFREGYTTKILPEKLESIVNKLKSGESFTIAPSGFGTAYIYSTKRYAYSMPADQDISNRVGQPVFYVTQDRD